MATSTTRKTTSEEWVEISKTCIVLFPFNASHKFQLPLSVGDLVHIHAQTADSSNSSNGNSDSSAPTSPSLTNAAASGGWYSGVSVNTQESGIFPQSYVVILPENTNTEDSSISQASTPISTKLSLTNQEMTNSSLLNEVTSTIVEWATLLKIFSQNKQHNDFKILSQRITCLIQFKNQLLAFKSPKEITFELRDKILGVIDEGRQETGMSIVLRKEMSNIHTYYNSNSRNTTNTILPTSTATDLVLADAENSGVFNLCTMYQERKYLAVQENIKILESLKNDQSSLNGSGGNINNGQNGGGGGGGSMSNLSPSTSSGNIGIISGGGSSTSLRESGEKGTPANTSNTAPVAISSSPVGSPSSNKSSGGGEKVSKFSSSMNLLNSVRIKGKSSLGSSGSILPSLSSSSSSNGSSPSSSAILSSSSSNSSSNLNINGNNTTSSTQSLSNSTISVTSNPQASSLTLNGQNGSQSTSSLNLNSPLQPIGASKKLQASNNPLKGSTGMGGPGIMKKQGSFLSNPASGANNQPSTSAGSSSAASDSSNKPLHTSSQLLVSVNNFLYSSGEFLEMIFTLYNKTENRFVTESYSGLIPPTGLFVEPENPNEKIRTIFKDLDSRDLQGELYLVTRIYRRTSSLSSKDPNSSPTLSRSSATAGSQHNAMPPTPAAAHKLFKKFIGCGVKRIDLSAQQESAFEVLITLYTSSNEAMFHNLHEQIIQENTGSYELITRAKGVVFTVQHYLGEYSHFLNENIAMRNVSISQKMCLPEVILPGYDRNDMYVQIEEGEFSDKNVEVGMLIKNESGMTMNDTIKFANGQQEISEYRTPVLVSGSSGKWGETVRVWMASKSYEKSHLFFLVRQCSEKKDKERAPLAFGYLKFIGDDGAIIKDGVHTIQLYKVSSDDVPIATYINGVNETGGKKDKKGTSDVIRIRTTFVSTCLTQNHLVVNLARWQSFQGDLSSLVKDITFLGSHELVRNLQEIFFNFLSILDQQLNDSPLSMEIFRSFIFIIGVLVDSRTTNYRPALDTYVSKFFGIPTSLSGQPSGMSAHSHLLRSVVKNLDNFQDPSNASRISSSLKALEYIFKMVVASKTKFPNKDTANANDTYQKNLKNVVDILCEIMLSNAPSLIGAQTIALKNFEGMFSDLKRFFTIEEMAIIAVKFMRSIQHLEKNKTFNLLKLKLLSSYLHGQLMLNKDTRKQLHPIVFQTLQFHFGKSVEETDMCLTILGLIVDIMITKSEMRGRDKDEWLLEMMSFFTPILELLQLINFVIASSSQPIKSRRSSSAASLNGASPSLSLSALVSIMSEDQLYDLRLKIYAFILGTSRLAGVHNWEMFSRSVQSNKTFFVDLYESLQHLFISPKFPTDFWTFTVFQLKTILRMTRILEDVTFYSSKEPSKGSTSYDFGMWRAFFMLTTSYLNCKDLQLESVNPAKAIFLKTRCGDVRIEMARVFERVWTTVPIKERAAFIPVLIDPIMKLSISDTMDAKRVATKIYYDMLESEVLQTGGYSDLMTRTIDSLLEIGTGVSDGMTWPTIGAGSVDGKLPFTMKTFQTFFYVQCMQLVLSKSTDAIRKKAEQFIGDIVSFLTLLTTFMSDIKGGDEEEIFGSVAKLIYYLQETKRYNHFIRFVHMCSKRHFSNGNFVEAGVTVMLHASLYQWDHNKVINSINNEYGSFHVQKESERKELLYKEILACFNKGKAWERAIPLLKELIHHFTMNICDMNSAATYLRQQGTFYQKINESELVFEEYFRVGYYGKRFPASIQNREFIYKGNEFERLSDFITKTLDKWPKAELLKSTETPSKEVMESDGMHVLITSVNVSSMAEAQKRQSLNLNGSDGAFAGGKKRVPQRVQQFNARTKVNVFLYSKPFKKQANRSSTNEFEDLWLNNHYLVCETPFPCTERRSLVVDRISVEVSPIENALNSIVQKNEELLARIDRYQQNQNENINPLTMTLNGIIDASVNGGVSRYELFLTEPYLSKHPENKHIADCLRVSMDQQIVVLEKALKLHGTLINSSMAAMQEKLESIFNTMKSEKTAKYMYNN